MNNHPKTINEISSNECALTKTLGGITTILKQIHQNQQQPPPPQQQYQPVAPQRVCGICACNSHYTDEFSQLQEDNTLVATNPYFNHSNQGPYQ
ncbi:hypothetical protein AHAS_Ahas04G0102700 [Arachis hypogaea]